VLIFYRQFHKNARTIFVSCKKIRKFINAVFWVLRTGAPWRDLPPDYGDWSNIHRRFSRWRNNGTWEKMPELFVNEEEFIRLMIDASHVKCRPDASGAVGGNQDMERTKGSLIPRYTWSWMRLVCRSFCLVSRDYGV
jgi:transposase